MLPAIPCERNVSLPVLRDEELAWRQGENAPSVNRRTGGARPLEIFHRPAAQRAERMQLGFLEVFDWWNMDPFLPATHMMAGKKVVVGALCIGADGGGEGLAQAGVVQDLAWGYDTDPRILDVLIAKYGLSILDRIKCGRDGDVLSMEASSFPYDCL